MKIWCGKYLAVATVSWWNSISIIRRLRKEMGATFASDFKAAHPDEIGPDGKIKVCVGGGGGFIGSHIAKRLKLEVK